MRAAIKLFFDSFAKLYLKSENNPMCRVNRYSSPAPASPRTSSSVFRRFGAELTDLGEEFNALKPFGVGQLHLTGKGVEMLGQTDHNFLQPGSEQFL
jgi:hypothetical protein